jgi:tellurite resistance protein
MAGKTDFTEQEWESLQKGVVGSGLFVSLSDRGFFDTFKEAGALGKHVAQAKQKSSSELIRELADVHGTGFGVTSSPETVEKETLASLRTAKAALEEKAPDEVENYRQFVLEVAQSVADAAGGGDAAESDAIEKIAAALR